MKGVILLLMLPLSLRGMDRLAALSFIETGNNDFAVGRAGEVSRYQIRREEWRRFTNCTRYTDPQVARRVAERILAERSRAFRKKFGRTPSPYELYALWNAPAQALKGRLSRDVAERSRRFRNLVVYR